MARKLKVGDKVTIRKDLVIDGLYDGVHFVDGMNKYKGKKAIITNIDENTYTIDLDYGNWIWTIEMFEPVKTTKKQTKKVIKEVPKDYVTREEFEAFKKQVENNKVVEQPKVEKKATRFRAKNGEIYWSIDSCGDVVNVKECNDNVDNFRYNTKNYYETEEECKRALEILDILNKYSYNFKLEELADINIYKYYIYVSRIKRLNIDSCIYLADTERHFKNKEDCQHAIYKIGYDDYIKYCIMGGIK